MRAYSMKKIMLTLLAIGSLGLVTISAQVTSTKYIIDFNIDVDSCQTGMYFLTVVTNDQIGTQRLSIIR